MTANKTYAAAEIKDLPAGKFREALRELHPLATDANEAARVGVTAEWIRRGTQTRIASVGTGEAGGIMVIHKG